MNDIIRSHLFKLFTALVGLLFATNTASLAADARPVSNAGGTISGTVSNATTGNLLEGADVRLPRLGLSTLADRTGSFEITGVPEGNHEIVASYTGLDPQRFPVTVSAGGRATHDFDLTSSVYRMGAFKVAGEREGMAAAITA